MKESENRKKDIFELEEEFNIEKTKFDLRNSRILENIYKRKESKSFTDIEEVIEIYRQFNNMAEKFLKNMK